MPRTYGTVETTDLDCILCPRMTVTMSVSNLPMLYGGEVLGDLCRTDLEFTGLLSGVLTGDTS